MCADLTATGALAMLVHATGLMVSQRFTAEVATLVSGVEVVVLPPPCPLEVHPMDFGHADELMTRAEADARAFLSGRGAVIGHPAPSAPVALAARR